MLWIKHFPSEKALVCDVVARNVRLVVLLEGLSAWFVAWIVGLGLEFGFYIQILIPIPSQYPRNIDEDLIIQLHNSDELDLRWTYIRWSWLLGCWDYLKMSTAERALIDISQDRRYWIIHSITIPSLFVGGVIFMLSGFVYKLFGALNFNKYFDKDNSSISLIKDRFSICSSMDDI